MPKSTAEKNKELALRIAKQLVKNAGRGLDAARIFLVGRIKEELSVAAPREAIRSGGGIVGYRATTKATPGAPPRKLSGRLRSSVWSKMVDNNKTAVIAVNARGNPTAKYPMGFNYPKYHELKLPGMKNSGKHPYILPTAIKWRRQLKLLIGSSFHITEVG